MTVVTLGELHSPLLVTLGELHIDCCNTVRVTQPLL